jgi:protein-disulfide isomerase
MRAPKPAVSDIGRSRIVLAVFAVLSIGSAAGCDGNKKDSPTGPPVATEYRSQRDFPEHWVQSSALTGIPGVDMEALNEAQKTRAMQALNERDCDCGCNKGSLAVCTQSDRLCPRSPAIAREVVKMAGRDRQLSDLLAYVDSKNPRAPGARPRSASLPLPAIGRNLLLSAHHPRKGPKHAKVTIVQFSDFQCPACKSGASLLAQLAEAYPKDVAFVFVNLPLRKIHPAAGPAALAFMAAHRQGRAWEMHDRLFASQHELTAAAFERHAAEMGLDVVSFRRDMADKATEDLLLSDERLADRVRVRGTPSFFLNGREESARDPGVWKTLIDQEIGKANELLGKGTPLEDLYRIQLEALDQPPSVAPPPRAER